MDINEKITRNKKVEHKPEPKNEAPHVFDLHCSVELLDKDIDILKSIEIKIFLSNVLPLIISSKAFCTISRYIFIYP